MYDDLSLSDTSIPESKGKRWKKRKSNFSNNAESVIELSDISDSELCPPHVDVFSVKMSTNEVDIKITNRKPITYHMCTNYDITQTEKGENWHLIVIHHKQKYRKREILAKLFEVVSDSEFFPVAYRQSKFEDYFYIRLCRAAIGKLFQNELKIKMLDDEFMYLTIKLNVADYKLGQIYPSKKLHKACTDRFNDLITCEGVTKVLNLDNISGSPELNEIVINLSNNEALQLLCNTLNNSHEMLNSINGLKLSNNHLRRLLPLQVLPKINLQMIDLRNNDLRDIAQLKHLKKLSFHDLYISGNPLAESPNYVDAIKDILPCIVKVDGIYSRHLRPYEVHVDTGPNTIEVIFKGDTINAADYKDQLYFRKYKSSDMWHHVIINHAGKYSKTEILRSLMHQLTSHEFFPCYYKVDINHDSFFIRNGYQQLEHLYNSKLLLTMLPKNDIITITLTMNVAIFKLGQINPPVKIQKCIGASFNWMDKVLNYENFAANEELKHIEVSLANPRTLAHILLQGARQYLSNIEKLNISNNGIMSAKGMHPLNWMKALKSIDLSNNQINDISELESIPKLAVTDVKLEGNPLCKKFCVALEYVAKVKKIFSDMIRLDGESLSSDGCCVPQKNYLCSLDGYDLVEQFVEHFFKTYDSVNRQNLKGIYASNAVMTMSSNFSGISKTNESQLTAYISRSRNMLKMANYNLVHARTLVGPEPIIAIWKGFGPSEHDFQSFTIDLIYYTNSMAVFTVNGLFKEEGATLNQEELVLGFVRTFVLRLKATGLGMFGRSTEYKIYNEQVLFYRPSIVQTRNSFKNSKDMVVNDESNTTPKDKEGLIIIFQELTNLIPMWCVRCLEQSSWNFRNALELFVHLCQENKIPNVAFQFPNT